MQTISPFLWFDDKAEEAINFYVSIFKNSKIVNVSRYGEGGPSTPGMVMSAIFELNGQEFMALNGGPMFTFSPAISFFVKCETQAEVDHLWDQLSAGGETQRCGWLKDKYGLSWQIIPNLLGELLQDPDREKAGRVMQAMLQMDKIESQGLNKRTISSGRRPPMAQTVDDFMAGLEHPYKQEIIVIRQMILGADPSISEGIKWHAPSFQTTAYFATFHLRAKDGVQLILHLGAKVRDTATTGIEVADPETLLQWLAKDRAVVTFRDLDAINTKRTAFVNLIRAWIRYV